MTNDWYDIKFMESATNVRELLGNSMGRTPSANIAREIAVCIQQGRLFFEAASAAPIQIKPLQIYYGVVAFAQAVIVARNGHSLSTLARAHGLTDTTSLDAGVEGLVLRVENNGTYQEFNDTVAPLGRIWYFDSSMPKWYEKPFDSAAGLSGLQITITDILARAPGLAEKFAQTFGSSGKTIPIMLNFGTIYTGSCTLRIDDPVLFTDRASLVASIQRLRSEYPFLEQWRFTEAQHAWGNSIIVFDNTERRGLDDLSEDNLIEANNNGFASGRAMVGAERTIVPAIEILPPLSGGYTRSGQIYAMQPINNVNLSEYALQFLGAFLLSSLVRYRPQIWQNAISRSVTAQSPADDRSLSLIEEFLDDVLSGFPEMVVRVMDYQRTR
ncbi:YaaC family protein [Bradyrhizobium sp. SZCCHNRI1073]|uniref:YaaC family protein n=1 Tax=Bradyrhizobium sp. SZCCHNRI1073 TaxID=3057280 RepID=UPI002916D525|nr:YaaC family protein [Bradyrhizobium sp. SZCCHNRI1073]